MTNKKTSFVRNLAAFCTGLMLCSATAQASLPIELEVAIESGASLTAPQEWTRLLGKMDLARERLRNIRASDQPKVTTVKVGSSTRYQVLAILSRRDELIFPDRRFKDHERRSLQAYFEQLPVETKHSASPRGRFDLTELQFRKLFAELSRPVDFGTLGEDASVVLSRLEKMLSVPMVRVPLTKSLLAKPLKSELKGLSAGTAIAIALRQEGLVLRPQQLRGETLQLVVEVYRRGEDAWPLGWKPEKSIRHVAPHLLDKLELAASNITFAEVLPKLEPRLKVPVLLDHWTLTQKNIEIEKVQVKLARRKTYLKGALDRLASQAKLSAELRVDEVGKPFLWITNFGKDSPRAAK